MLITAAEAAEILGVGLESVYGYAARGILPRWAWGSRRPSGRCPTPRGSREERLECQAADRTRVGCPEMTRARSTVVFRWIASYGSITIVQTTVRGDGSIRMPSWVIESSQPGAVVVSAVVPVLSQDIDVTLVSPEPPSRKFT